MRKYAGKKFASTRYQTHKHQVMSQTHSPLSHPGWASYISLRQMLSIWACPKGCYKELTLIYVTIQSRLLMTLRKKAFENIEELEALERLYGSTGLFFL